MRKYHGKNLPTVLGKIQCLKIQHKGGIELTKKIMYSPDTEGSAEI